MFVPSLRFLGSCLIVIALALPGAASAREVRLSGRVVRPGDAGWDEGRTGFAAASNFDANTPQAIVYCQDEQDVVNAVDYCREKKVPCRPRSGRHSYEGYSSFARGGVIVDMSEMTSFTANSDGTEVKVGAGMRMFALYEELGKRGLALPLATRPTVGVAGLTLGGGVGVTSRKWGLTADNLTSLRLVLWNGEKINVSQTEYPDLFWALRGGGGGNVGIVTSFTFRPHRIGKAIIFKVQFSWADFDRVVARWQDWGPNADTSISCVLALVSANPLEPDPTPGVLELYGQYTPEPDATDASIAARFRQLIAPMLDGFPTAATEFSDPIDSVFANRLVLGLDPDPRKVVESLRAYHKHQLYKSTSAFAMRTMTTDEIVSMRKQLESVPPLKMKASQPSMVQLLCGGGAMHRDGQPEGVTPYRKTKFILQFDGYWTDPQDAAPTTLWVNRFRKDAVARGYGQGAYINYMDRELDMNLEAFGAENHARLIRIKHRYDPHNFFDGPQGWLAPAKPASR
jgi:FAD/FMN-containing dehydrogenase